MKLVAACILCLLAATAGAYLIGYGPTMSRWGEEGIRSMNAVGTICLAAAIVAFMPLVVVLIHRPAYIGQVALAGTVLRLLLTMAAGGIYQTMAKPQMESFLLWAVIFYCLLLTVETGFGVLLVKKYYRSSADYRGTPA